MGQEVQKQITELEQAIAAQDGLRSILGDSVVDMTIATLREKLALLQPSFPEERKLLTCLFCDIVGSTRIAADRDPEEVLNIIDGALREMATSVDRFGGTVGRYMGDGVLAIFGAPRALERHAEQAILAGLDIQKRMQDYEKLVLRQFGLSNFKVRIGINSGHVVAGQVAGAKGEYTVIGDAVNIASRFEAAAPPGGILVGESTFRLANGKRKFQAKALEPIEVKGALEPLVVYLVTDVNRIISAPSTRSISRAPLTGRDAELNILKDRYLSVGQNNKPQQVIVIGPAGIGKTRLKQEFVQWISEDYPAAALWKGRVFSYDSHTPYRLVRDLLGDGLNIIEADSAEDRRVKLEFAWSAAGDLTLENLHGLAAILAIRYPDDSLDQLEPQARRTAIFESFVRFCEGQTKIGDLVLVLEDTQWADDLSLEVFEYLFSELPDSPIYILMLTRPVTDPGAKALEIRSRISRKVYSEVDLNELTSEEVEEMIQALLQSKKVPKWLTGAIVKRAQGNPFFIEEIINSFIEDGTLARNKGEWTVTRDAAEIQVPDTVQAVLAARIDRLDPELKHVIQNAAIVGRVFWQQLLTNLTGAQVDSRLTALAEQDFVLQQGRAALVEDWEWIFRHVLVQEVAYDSVLKEVRRQVHYLIAQWLEQHASDRLYELAPNLARHYELGQTWDKAIDYLEQSADHSRNLYALQEALLFYDRAMRIIKEHPDAANLQTALRMQEDRGEVRGLVGEFESAVSDLNEVLASAKTAGDKEGEHKLLVSLGMIYRRADDYENAMSYLSQALEVARESGAKGEIADALYHLGSVAWSEGNNVLSTTFHEEAVEICRELGLRDLVAVQALHGRGEAYWFSGRPQMAVDYLTESLEIARDIGDKSYESENLQMIGLMHNPGHGTAESEKALDYARSSLAISQSAHMEWHTIPALLTLAPPYIQNGDYDQALKIIREANGQARSVGSLRMLTIGLDALGCLYQELNVLDEAQQAHQQGVDIADEIGSNFWQPRLRANLLIDKMRLGDLDVGQDLLKVYEEANERDQVAHAVRSLEGVAELSVKIRDYQGAIAYTDELQSIAQAGGMVEQMARASHWKGEALIGTKDYQLAESSLQRALELASKIGAIRRLWDIHTAFVRLFRAQGKDEEAQHHEKLRQEIIENIADNLVSEELRTGFSLV